MGLVSGKEGSFKSFWDAQTSSACREMGLLIKRFSADFALGVELPELCERLQRGLAARDAHVHFVELGLGIRQLLFGRRGLAHAP